MILAEDCDDIPHTGNAMADAIIVIAFLVFAGWLAWLWFR